jgi:flavin reductase (DIM6/NTAB) family NADH-FMN oxidoreductase RutF
MSQTLNHFNQSMLLEMDSRKRANFINSLTGFKSIGLIGTKGKNGIENLAIFNSFVHLGANPCLLGFISRPEAHLRHTVPNIIESQYYTVNHITEDIYQQAHQTSARYPANVSEFDACGLSPEFKDGFYAPFVKDSKIKLALRMEEKMPIALNGTTLVVASIQDVYIPDEALVEDGFVDLLKAETVAGVGLDGYLSNGAILRYQYAKPGIRPELL